MKEQNKKVTKLTEFFFFHFKYLMIIYNKKTVLEPVYETGLPALVYRFIFQSFNNFLWMSNRFQFF